MTLKGEALHLKMNLGGCDKKLLADKKFIKKFLNKLPGKVGMKLLKKAKPIRYEAELYLDSGISGTAILVESHVSIHTFPHRKFAFIDVFSCCGFDSERTIALIVEAFKSEKYKFWLTERGDLFDDYKEVEDVIRYGYDERLTLDAPAEEDE